MQFIFIYHFTFANQYKSQVSKLYKISTGTYTTMFKYARSNIFIY